MPKLSNIYTVDWRTIIREVQLYPGVIVVAIQYYFWCSYLTDIQTQTLIINLKNYHDAVRLSTKYSATLSMCYRLSRIIPKCQYKKEQLLISISEREETREMFSIGGAVLPPSRQHRRHVKKSSILISVKVCTGLIYEEGVRCE